MKSKTKWIIAFLGLTSVVIGMEVFAATFWNENRPPWTELIVNYIPFEVFCLVWGGLAIWISVHFLKYYGIIKVKK